MQAGSSIFFLAKGLPIKITSDVSAIDERLEAIKIRVARLLMIIFIMFFGPSLGFNSASCGHNSTV